MVITVLLRLCLRGRLKAVVVLKARMEPGPPPPRDNGRVLGGGWGEPLLPHQRSTEATRFFFLIVDDMTRAK